ncbi:MAG: hypothetical protein JXA57_13485 [Armatimonadetes bacterium]|nr:hypothetical protein [Armatimonadota bacterium]
MSARWLLVAGLLLLSASSLWAGPFTAVPADHWSYRACVQLSSLGVLAEQSQTNFTGTPELTRFEFGIALVDPLTAVDQSVAATGSEADAETKLSAVLQALNLTARQSESDINDALGDLYRLTREFADVLQAMNFDTKRVLVTLPVVRDEEAIRRWRLDNLAQPERTLALSNERTSVPTSDPGVRVPLAHGTVGLSLSNPAHAPELLDYLAKSVSADYAKDLGNPGGAEAALTDPRISRLRTTYEYGVGSTLTLSLAYEEIARRGQGLTDIDAASLTSLGIGYQLTPSTSVQLSYSLLEYSNYALDTPPLRDRFAETAVSIEF